MITLIHGPEGCGKTRNADKFAKFFGATRIVEFDDIVNNDDEIEILEGDLILTNRQNDCFPLMDDLRVLSFDKAMALLDVNNGRS